MKHNKIIILGDSSVGKTSMINRWIKGSLQGKPPPTIGSAYSEVTYDYNDHQHKVQVWDTAGEEKYKSMAPIYARGATAALVVFALDKKASLENLPQWISCLDMIHNIKIAVVGNKMDLPGREVSQEEGRELAEKFGAKYFETSAATGDGLGDLFNTIITDVLKDREKLAVNQPQGSNILVEKTDIPSGCSC